MRYNNQKDRYNTNSIKNYNNDYDKLIRRTYYTRDVILYSFSSGIKYKICTRIFYECYIIIYNYKQTQYKCVELD